MKKFKLLCALLSLLTLIVGCKNSINIKLSDSENSRLTLTPQFNLDSTGWLDSSSNAIKVQVTSTLTNPTLSCRYAHTSEVSTKAFSTCNLVNGYLSLTQPAIGTGTTYNNGTFELQVKAIGEGVSDITKSIKFYTHESLNSASVCPALPKTDAEYLEIASQYLDQSLAFRDSTSLKIPFVHVDVPAIPAATYRFADGSLTDVFNHVDNNNIAYGDGSFSEKNLFLRSLRKRFSLNDAKTLLLIKRQYAKKSDSTDCRFSIIGQDQVHDLANNQLPNLPLNNYSSSGTSSEWLSRGIVGQCDAFVMNGLRKGVCFKGSHIYFARRLTSAFRLYGNSKTKTRFTSRKFTNAEKTDYDLTIANAKADDPDAEKHFIFLDE